MASQDVIELGSSDDEPEPAPKKVKTKPLPDSMVEIPSRNLKEMHFRQNTNLIMLCKKKKFAPQNRKDNMSSSHSPYLMKTVKFMSKPNLPNIKVPKIPSKINQSPANIVTNPIKIMNDNVVRFSALSPKITHVKSINPFAKQIRNVNAHSTLTNLKTQSQKCLNKLPPSITVTKTSGNEKKYVRPVLSQQVVVKKRKIVPSTPRVSEVLTVDLDDDDISEPRPHPVWCLKPEENTNEMEIQNNNEPEPQTVEITIEDSPVKELQNEFGNNEIGRILEITIDDSPVKLPQMSKVDNQSDSSADDKTMKNKRVPQSKKKLEYPNEVKDQDLEKEALKPNVEQMEIDPSINKNSVNETAEGLDIAENSMAEQVSDNKLNNVNKKQDETLKNDQSNEPTVIEVSVSPAKQSTQNIAEDNLPNNCVVIEVSDSPAILSTQNVNVDDVNKKKVEKVKSVPKGLERQKEEEQYSTEREIHPVYQSFIDLCFKIEDTEDMKKIVEKKIKAYYKEVPKQYTESEEFIEMVSSKILAIKADPERMYLYIKDIVDELNMQRKLVKSKNIKEKVARIDDEIEIIEVEDPKSKNQIRKLEKALKKLHRAIQKLEEQEVDFDDEADSVYLLTESEEGNSSKDSEISSETDKNTLLQRYKERVVRVHAKLCKLTNSKMPSEPRVHIEARPGRPKGPAQRLEKWINKKVPIGTPLPFPDFHDVVHCVREANEADKLNWNEIDIMEEARDLFMRCGKKLQRRRQENEWRVAASRITAEVDPAEKDLDLKRKLDENKKVANVKELQIIDKYVDRQNKLKLEPQEIGDKEADQSPMESDEEVTKETKEQIEENKTLDPDKAVDVVTETNVSISNKTLEANTNNQLITDETSIINSKSENVSTVQLHKADQCFEIESVNEKVRCTKKISINKDTEQMELDEQKSMNISVISKEKPNEIIENKHESVELLSDDTEDDKEKLVKEEGSLLTVMCFETEGMSTIDSSDVDCPVAISDTVETSSTLELNGNGNNSSDVVSVEQTTNSDSEGNGNQTNIIKEVDENKINKGLLKCSVVTVKGVVTEVITEIAAEAVSPVKVSRKSNEEYTVAIEDILLASDDESIPDMILESDSVLEKEILASKEDNYINLKDDILTIEENVIESSNVKIKPKNINEKVVSVLTESNSSSSVVSLEDTCNTDTTDDAVRKIGTLEEIMISSDNKKENQKEISDITNLSSVDSIYLSAEKTNDVPRNIDHNNKKNDSRSENTPNIIHNASTSMSIEKNKLKNDIVSETETSEQTVLTGELVKDVKENISVCKGDAQKFVTLFNSDSQSLEAATMIKDTS